MAPGCSAGAAWECTGACMGAGAAIVGAGTGVGVATL